MVVSDDSNIDATEKTETISFPLKLEYEPSTNNDSIIQEEKSETSQEIITPEVLEIIPEELSDNSDIQQERINIVTESEFIDEVIPEIVDVRPVPKNVEISLSSKVETGLQIQFTSLKLDKFPIIDSNISSYLKIEETINLQNTNISIGNFNLYNVGIKIQSYPKFKMVEFKTREFKLALSVALTEQNTLKRCEDFFAYEISSRLKNSRLISVANIFQKIFSGELITFTINNLKGEISFENSFQHHKFALVENSISIYQNLNRKLNLNKSKNLSETSISFYTLYLLDQFINGKHQLNSWINFGIENSYDLNEGDFITFKKVHELGIKGINFNLVEKIKIKQPITEMELSRVKDKVTCYKKTVTIELEKIEK